MTALVVSGKAASREPARDARREPTVGRVTATLTIRNAFDVQKAAEGEIEPSGVRSIEVEAMVDTGAAYVCLPREHIEQLGLLFLQNVSVLTANGQVTRRTFMSALVELHGRKHVAEIMENDEQTPPLVGYLLLEALDLVVDPKSQQVIGNPAHEGKWVADLL